MVRAKVRARTRAADDGDGGPRMMPALTTGVAAKGHRVRKGALVRREAFAERVLAAAEGAANATGKAVPKEKVRAEQHARRRASESPGSACGRPPRRLARQLRC